MFCALAYICMLLLHIKISFLTFDPKDAVITIGAMFFGPVSGITMSAIVAICELPVSDTGLYGLIMNFLSSAVFSSVAPMIYRKHRSISGAIIGLLCSVFSMTAVMMLANLLITPYYMGVSIGDVASLIPTLLLPFNLTKSVLNAALVLLLYKPVTNALRSVKLIDKSSITVKKSSIGNTVIVALSALAIIAVSLAVFYFVLGASF